MVVEDGLVTAAGAVVDDEAAAAAEEGAGCTVFVAGNGEDFVFFGVVVVADGIGSAVSIAVFARFAGGAPDISLPPVRACDRVRFTRTGHRAWICCWSLLPESRFIVEKVGD